MRRWEETMGRINWAAALVDICVMLLAFSVSFWQNNPKYLFLLLLLLGSGGYDFKRTDKRMTATSNDKANLGGKTNDKI